MTQRILENFIIILSMLLLVSFAIWLFLKSKNIDIEEGFFNDTSNTLINSHCNRIEEENREIPSLISLSNDVIAKNPLRNFYIKSAYNCCALNNFNEDYLDICALKNCLRQGARFLDFEIYSRNNIPVIAFSSRYDINSTNALNHIEFQDAIKIINTMAFSQEVVPNYEDPLILHFRIMSENTMMYNEMANVLQTYINKEYLLDPQYSFNNYKKNIGLTPIGNLLKKIVIIVSNKIELYENTKLYEYINGISTSSYIRLLTDKDTENFNDSNMKNYNRNNITIVFPNIANKANNIDSKKHFETGCQIVGMCFQKADDNMKSYHDYFKNSNNAFVLKPDDLRFALDKKTPADLKYLKYKIK